MTIAVIFDLDGLLVDTELISYKIYKEILADIGCEFSLEDYAKNLSGKTIALNVKYLIDNYRIPWTPEFGFSRIVEIENGFIIQGVDLKPGASELISWLKKMIIRPRWLPQALKKERSTSCDSTILSIASMNWFLAMKLSEENQPRIFF